MSSICLFENNSGICNIVIIAEASCATFLLLSFSVLNSLISFINPASEPLGANNGRILLIVLCNCLILIFFISGVEKPLTSLFINSIVLFIASLDDFYPLLQYQMYYLYYLM